MGEETKNMEIEKVKGGNWVIPEEKADGFSARDIFEITGEVYGKVAHDPIKTFANGGVKDDPSTTLVLHTLKQREPVSYMVSGHKAEENGNVYYSFNRGDIFEHGKFFRKNPKVIEEIAKNRRSARTHFGDVVYDDPSEEYMLDSWDDHVNMARVIWSDVPRKGKFTIKNGNTTIYGATKDKDFGHMIEIGNYTSRRLSYVDYHRFNGVKNQNNKRYDLSLSTSSRIAKFDGEDQDQSKAKARSYAKAILDHVDMR